MTFEIPTLRLENLIKKLDRLAKKTDAVRYEITGRTFKKLDFSNEYFEYTIMDIEGTFKLDNWVVIADIEHHDNGNIVRQINFDYTIPQMYKTTKSYCDHCKTFRHRNDTYLLYNVELNEFKQVGTTCLKDYTGIDATATASFFEILTEAMAFRDEVLTDCPFVNKYLDNELMIYTCYLVVKENGYNGEDTKEIAINKYYDISKENIDAKLVAKIVEWANTQTINSDYMQNAVIAINLDYITHRHVKLIASLIAKYLREEQERLANADKSFVGNIGDRITIALTSARVVFTSNNEYGWHNYQTTYTYILTDTNGNLYKWSTQTELNGNETIVATIKAHNEYKGAKQTIITNGRAC